MNIGESLRTGFWEICSHKMRSFLSFSSIAFGVAAILYTFAHVHRMYEQREKAFALAGPGRLEIGKKWQQEGKESNRLSKGLTLQDAETIREALPWLFMVSPVFSANIQFRHGSFEEGVRVTGITPEWRKRNWVYTLRGRFFTDHDVETAARVCILDEPGGWAGEKPFWARWWKDDAFDTFAKHKDMIGKTVRLNEEIFTVVGVLKNPPKDKDPRWFMRGGRGSVYAPITSVQRYLGSSGEGAGGAPDAIDRIIVDTGDEKTIPRGRRRIETLLSVRHRGAQDYEIEDFREMIQRMLSSMRKHAIAVLSVGIVAILAGGVGIMNVTLATIFSRVREIGIRRSIGATRSDILFQFVTEASMLGFLGGIAGIAIGLSGLHYLSEEGAKQIESLQWWHYAATLAIAAGCGFVFSLIPAYQASRLDPVEALRYE
ncbi:MAG: ABC transporter permease [Elusimicrobiota bacterium]